MGVTIAPYGSWKSPISVDSIVSKSRSFTCPRVNPRTGRAFYIESREETGGKTITEITKDGLKDILPAEYSPTNTVYEYGGSAMDVLPDDRIVFSNKDNTLHILDPDTGKVSPLASGGKLRYSNPDANASAPWVLAVEEDHENDTPYGVRNYVVAINTETSKVKRVLDTADFYFTPVFSPDGKKLAWTEWNHPALPFDASKLYWADWSPEGSVTNVKLISGSKREGAAEPRWGPDGSLFFGQETKGFRRLFRIRPGTEEPIEVELKGLDEAEFAEIRWFQGSHTYAPLTEKHVVAVAVTHGVVQVISIDLESGTWRPLADSKLLGEVMFDSMYRLSDSSFLVIGSGTTNSLTLFKIEIGDSPESDKIETIRKSTEEDFPDSIYSIPEVVHLRSKGAPSRDIYGFLWMPHNPDYAAPDGDLPPLIVLSHGGPTAYMGSGLKLRVQYFTSRGYACFALNHAGSTGYGREYREALFSNWGIIDSDDAAECAQHLVSAGRIKPDGVGITGASAGGYNTLQSLVRHPEIFSGGVCLSGVSDIKRLDESTHKLESDYTFHLVLTPESTEEDKKRIYRERSPLFNAERIKSPLLLLHGAQDFVVPLDQAEVMAKAIRDNGGDVKLIVKDDEAHGFFKPENVKVHLIEEEKWWQKTLL